MTMSQTSRLKNRPVPSTCDAGPLIASSIPITVSAHDDGRPTARSVAEESGATIRLERRQLCPSPLR
jgi:hypothetical protein